MVEQRDTVCLKVFEKKELHQSEEILEKYGIDTENVVSLRLDQGDFS